MKNVIALRGAVCATALLSSSAATADVTAADVWADWQKQMAPYGADAVTIGDEIADGDTLTITDITMAMSDEFSSVTTTLGPLVFTENGDGTVSVDVPDSYIIAVNMEDDFVVDLEVAQENLELMVSGDPDAMDYEISADSYTLRVAEFKGDAADVEGDIFVKANNLTGTYQSNTEAGLAYDLLAENVDVLFDIKEPGGDGYVLVSGKMDRLATDGSMIMPDGLDMDAPETWFANGFGVDSTLGYLGASFIADFNVDGDAGTASVQMGEGGFHATMNQSELAYGFAFDGVDVSAQMPDLPFPVSFSWDQAETSFFMLLESTDEAEPFGFKFALTEVAVSDDIWNMADPTGTIPREPVTAELELAGMAKLFFNILDPEQAEAMAFADTPGELNSLQLIGLRLAAAGAEITGAGDFTFDNSDLETFDGLPRPTGEVNIGMKGANALIDKVVEMGLLPAEQATMGRMFMGMFATPTGDDELSSKIEINDQGHIMANGQRIQ